MRHVSGRRSPAISRGGSPAPWRDGRLRDCVTIAITMIAIDTTSIATTANRLPRLLVGRSRGGVSAPGRYPCSAAAATIKSTITATTRGRWAITHPGRGQVTAATVWLDLPVLRAVGWL